METSPKIQPVSSSIAVSLPSSAGGSFSSDRSDRQAEQPTRYRLVIEEGSRTGTYVYKTLDGTTGEILRQFPREQVINMSKDNGYLAGALIDTAI